MAGRVRGGDSDSERSVAVPSEKRTSGNRSFDSSPARWRSDLFGKTSFPAVDRWRGRKLGKNVNQTIPEGARSKLPHRTLIDSWGYPGEWWSRTIAAHFPGA